MSLDAAAPADPITPGGNRLLLAGVGPLPPEGGTALFAPGLRTWGMARELALAGHSVQLITKTFGDPHQARWFELSSQSGQRDVAPVLKSSQSVPPDDLPGWIRHIAASTACTALVGTTDVMNHTLAMAELELPLWCDFFGDPLAEKQMLAAAGRNDGGLAPQWSIYSPVLARADCLSGCSAAQAAALWGQLGTLGRLNQFTFDFPLVHVLAPWLTPLPAPPPAPVFRGHTAHGGWPAEARVVIQTGGFNTWLDHDTLFRALELAMDAFPTLHFACTGGAIPGHFADGYSTFERAVAGSRHRERFHLLGWRPLEEVPALLAEADLALNIDRPCPEGELGTRNRLLDWALAGLPLLTTPGCPLARELAAMGLAELTPHGDAAAIARQLVGALAGVADRKAALAARRKTLLETFDPRASLAPLLAWARSPRRAPDLQAWRQGVAEPPALWVQARLAAALPAQLESARQEAAGLRAELARLTGSRLVRSVLKLKGQSLPQLKRKNSGADTD